MRHLSEEQNKAVEVAPLRPPAPPRTRAPRNSIRLVAVDLDGTLLNDDRQIGLPSIDALRQVTERGVRVVVASARPPRSVRHIYQTLKLDTWQINYNGALIWDESHQRTIFHRPMKGVLARRIADRARELFADVLVSCEILDRWYTDRVDQTYTTETGRIFKPDVVAPLDSFCHGEITKLLLLGAPRRITRLETVLADRYAEKVSVVRSDPELLQIMDRRVNKAAALAMVADHYGIAMQQVMAIGDAPNDVAMLQSAGVAVAMDNAHPLVRQVAHWVAPSNNDHGVCAALQRYGLC